MILRETNGQREEIELPLKLKLTRLHPRHSPIRPRISTRSSDIAIASSALAVGVPLTI